MEVASLELCLELHKLNGWEDTDYSHYTTGHDDYDHEHGYHGEPAIGLTKAINANVALLPDAPAYDLGYLLRKLPAYSEVSKAEEFYYATYYPNPGEPFGIDADTPEDAACKLLIELIRQGILPQQPTKGSEGA